MRAMDAETIKVLIEKGIPQAQVRVEDVRGDGQHFAAHVVSAHFMGKSKIQQHQMIYAALREINNQVHALAIQTGVPD